MKESGYYAPGTEFSPDAPWNQSEPEEREFDVDVVVSYAISAPVMSLEYTAEADYDDDGEGHSIKVVNYTYDGSPATDFAAEYMTLSDAIAQILPLIDREDKRLRQAVRTLCLYMEADYAIENG